MANVLLNTYCNRKCHYCFAKGIVDLGKDRGNPDKNMSVEALENVISFFKTSQLRRFCILGGEPTLHPDFNRIIDRVAAEEDFTSIMIFSNGLMPKEALDYLVQHTDSRIAIALNLNAPDNYTASELSRISKTMDVLGKKAALGINIYRSKQEYEYLIDAIVEYNLFRHIRVGLTQPIRGTNNHYARESDFPAIAEDLLRFGEKTYAKNITFSFDCGFQFCMFTLEQHKELLRLGIDFKSNCTPIIDIGPDLNVWRCFPLSSDVCGKLTDFESKFRITDFYNKKYKSFIPMGNRPECPQCRYRANSLCSGGCLARTLISFRR